MAGIFGAHLIDLMISRVYVRLRLQETTISQFVHALKCHLKSPTMLFQFIFEAIKKFYGYMLVILAFIAFLFINGSIVGKFQK
jgi:hypothetical protein